MGNQTFNTKVKSLGPGKHASPLEHTIFIDDCMRILYSVAINDCNRYIDGTEKPVTFEQAGPRKQIFFNPLKTKCAIVTCGGLCPGLNNVISSIVRLLHYGYGVKDCIGFRYGYKGMAANDDSGHIRLTPDVVSEIHTDGGSILSSSRGPQDINRMVDNLVRLNVDILFVIGGDGTMHGALDIVKEVEKRGIDISVIGIPKTIDNDIQFISKSFGFETAFSSASEAIHSAHTESRGAPFGIGLVKLMGRHSGFIAANASLAQKDVNFCLIPEIDFDLAGEKGLLNQMRKRLIARNHAVVVVAEGAGQRYFNQDNNTDESGNKKLEDIGIFLKQQFIKYFDEVDLPVTVKYIDPSYIIRAVPAIPAERVFCGLLANNAVHAAMAGKTGAIIGIRNNMFIHVPIETAIMERKHVNPEGNLWQCVLASTGQGCLVNDVG